MPEISSTWAGVYFFSTSRRASKFSQRSSTYFLSYSPSSRITCIMPLIQATSEPGRCRSQCVANRVMSMARGSTTISRVPCCVMPRFM